MVGNATRATRRGTCCCGPAQRADGAILERWVLVDRREAISRGPIRVSPRAATATPAGSQQGQVAARQGLANLDLGQHPPGYKVWVGDLPANSTFEEIKRRLFNTMIAANLDMDKHWQDINALVVKERRSESGASYCAITVDDLTSAWVRYLT